MIIRKEIYLPIIGIVIAEVLMFFNMVTFGFLIYNLNLLTIIFMILLYPLEKNIKSYLQGVMLLIILKIVNLSLTPFIFSNNLLIYGVMFIPIYSIFRNQKISYKELGIDFRRLIYFPILILFIILFASTLNNYLKFNMVLDVLSISVEMLLIVGTVEEFIFRSVLQNRIEKILDGRLGIILSGLIFGIMHSNYGLLTEIIFSGIFGLGLGYIFYKTRNLFLAISLHGSANVFLYGTFPLLSIGSLSLDTILLNGEIMSLFLIILVTISFVIINTKYWNKCSSRVLEMSIYPLLVSFGSIILFKIINIYLNK